MLQIHATSITAKISKLKNNFFDLNRCIFLPITVKDTNHLFTFNGYIRNCNQREHTHATPISIKMVIHNYYIKRKANERHH